jgi:DNA-binding NarL/FixJ family response regulator
MIGGAVRILIVDDHPVVRAGLRAVLDGEHDLEIVGDTDDAESAVEAAHRLEPDVVLMDLRLGTGPNGAEATSRIRGRPSPPAVLVLTNYDTDADILSAIAAGASGYLLKDAPPAELVAAVRAAAAGESALAPSIAGRLLDRLRAPQVALTPREVEVLELVAAGRSNAETAARLHVSDTTVKSHLSHINGKLGVGSRGAAVAAGRRLGIIG